MVRDPVAIIWAMQLIFNVKDDRNGEILNTVENGRPHECLQGGQYEPPYCVRDQREDADHRHGPGFAAPTSPEQIEDGPRRHERHHKLKPLQDRDCAGALEPPTNVEPV